MKHQVSKNAIKYLALATSFAALAACSTAESSTSFNGQIVSNGSLTVQRYVGSEAGFLVTSNLVVGQKQAILIDAQFTRSDAKKVVEMIKNSGRELKSVFVTHGHPDHYFGAEIIKRAFPQARFVATSETVQDIKSTGPGKLSYWKPIYKEELTDTIPSFDIATKEDLTLDGEEFELRKLLPGESAHATVLVVRSLKAAFVGDMAYDEVHLWLAEAANSMESWKQNLTKIQKDDGINSIYVGHQKHSRTNNKSVLNTNIDYINQASQLFSSSVDAKAAADQLKQKYPSFALPVIADIAADALVSKN